MNIDLFCNPSRKFCCLPLAPLLAFLLLPILVAGLTGCDPKQPPATPAATSKTTAPAVEPAPQPSAALAAPPAQTAQQRQAQQQVQQLIGQVESIFQSGEAHYRGGQLVQAKLDFDRAVDLMLASGFDVKGDPQLNDEFNRILDSVNALEMEALKQGNGFAPKVEPTPAEVAGDVTFAVDPNLVATAKAQLATTKSDLPLVINDYVAGYINFFANTQRGHYTLLHSLQRSGRYKSMIQRVLTEEGVPQDLIYLAVAESAFQPQAIDGKSGAGGMWQFMPHGEYGLVRNGYIDERFDPEKSTRAYAKYMKFLYTQLGDWYLAMAAYDWGAGNVQRAVQKTGYADFWELYKRNNLPGETKNYVPEILAAIIISRNMAHYGFDDVQLDPPIITDTVNIDYSVDLRLVADLVDAEPQEITALNPGLLRLSTPPSSVLNAPFALHLPPGTATLYLQRVAAIPADRRNQWRYHRVTPEDTLASVARSYHVSVEQLASVNQIRTSDSLDSVDALVVPVPPPAASITRAEVYKARRGDTLVKIADRFGVSLDDLHRWNHLSGTTVAAGARIHVTEPAHVASRTGEHSHTNADADISHKPGSKHTTSAKTASTSGSKGTDHASRTTASKQEAKQKSASSAPSSAHESGDPKKTKSHNKTGQKKNIQK